MGYYPQPAILEFLAHSDEFHLEPPGDQPGGMKAIHLPRQSQVVVHEPCWTATTGKEAAFEGQSGKFSKFSRAESEQERCVGKWQNAMCTLVVPPLLSTFSLRCDQFWHGRRSASSILHAFECTPPPTPPSNMTFRSALLILLAGVAFSVSSCVVPEQRVPEAPAPGSVGVLEVPPVTWNQPYFYYNSRYYYGGKWETGNFEYRGHTFTNRYLHNGHYLYGGRYNDGLKHAKTEAHQKRKKHH